MSQLAVILPASGSSTRFGRNKLIEPLSGSSVFARSLRQMSNHDMVGFVVVATFDPDVIRIVSDEMRESPITSIASGGPSRAHSVLNALRKVPEQFEWVAI